MDIILPETSGPFILGVEGQNGPFLHLGGPKVISGRGPEGYFCRMKIWMGQPQKLKRERSWFSRKRL